MQATSPPRIELPAGYTMSDRLGAGGYGEVWRATAPGGVEKAIKVVFGHCDEDLAERELKSLERIKGVRHPFVLSLERYEVVNGRLIIVTELADMSLDACYQKHCQDRLPGIPRKDLLGYLSDAADALDCLVERHSLQHLDIKPENLLLVGDHVKVADFGLVKDIAARTLNSMMGGMTPVYAAPEIYDDNPSPKSDQYSLAIVYQQMLTGSLPFPGKTPAQLAKQHTQDEPNLQALSQADQKVVRRALAKRPDDRFGSCSEFVAALTTGYAAGVGEKTATDKAEVISAAALSPEDTKSLAASHTAPIQPQVAREATQALAGNAVPVMKRVEQTATLKYPEINPGIVDVPATFGCSPDGIQFVPTLFIGTGGLGTTLLATIKRRICELASEREEQRTAWLAIDTDKDTLKSLSLREDASALATRDTLHIPLRRPKQYRDASQNMLRWVSRRWLYNIPRSLTTRGFRPLGRIALVDHADQIVRQLKTRLAQLTEDSPQKLRVILLAGMGGGTGGGTIIDLAQAVRSLAEQDSIDIEVHGLLGITFRSDGKADSLAAANMHSFLTELNHAQQFGNAGSAPPAAPADQFESTQKPFDEVYCVTIPGSSAERSLCLNSVADYVGLETIGLTRPIVASCREHDEATRMEAAEKWALRAFACVAPDRIADHAAAAVGVQVRQQILAFWLSPSDALLRDETTTAAFGSLSSSIFAQTILNEFPPVPIQPVSPDETNPTAPQNMRRRFSIKHAASALIAQVERFSKSHNTTAIDPESQLVPESVRVLANQIVAEFCKVLRSFGEKCPGAEERLQEILEHGVEEHVAANATSTEDVAQTALHFTDVGVLDCGFRRRSFLVKPSDADTPSKWSAFEAQRPTMQNFSAKAPETFVICEGNGLLPVHLAGRISEVFPEIDEAAGRLHARSDIEWSDLREQISDS